MISSFHLHDQHLMIINEPRVLRGVFKAINQLHCNSENQQISTMIDGCCRTNVYLRTELLNTALKWRAYKKRKELPASKSTQNFSHFFCGSSCWEFVQPIRTRKKVCFLSLPVKFPITTKINISLWMETFSRVILAPQFPRALESNSREKSLEMQHKMLVKKSRLFGGRDKSRRNSRVNATMCSMYWMWWFLVSQVSLSQKILVSNFNIKRLSTGIKKLTRCIEGNQSKKVKTGHTSSHFRFDITQQFSR